MTAFWAGVLAGFGIAVPVGAIAVLIVDVGIRRGFRTAAAAGLGAASADLIYAAAAAVLGAGIAAVLEPVADELRIASVVVLLAIVAVRLATAFRDRPASAPDGQTGWAGAGRTYAAFLGLTLLNPVTIAYFAALIVGLQADVASGALGKAVFVLGAFVASAAWQTVLAAAGSFLRHRLAGRTRLMTVLVGNIVILGFAARLLLGG